jgi:ankyrin repeat protein
MSFYVKHICVIDNDLGSNGEHHDGVYRIASGKPMLVFNTIRADATRILRMVRQIEALALYARDNQTGSELTHLATNEFSFYTNDTPLSLSEYKELIGRVALSLTNLNLPPNIILVISSMPVLWSDSLLRNVVLHIQSPNSPSSAPLIHHFSKENTSRTDPLYVKNNEEDSVYSGGKDDYNNLVHSPHVVLKDTAVKCDSPNQYKGAIIVHGVGIPAYLHVVEICMDHAKKVGLFQAKQLPHAPFRGIHTITSNTINVETKGLVAEAVHVDHNSKYVTSPCIKSEEIETYFGQRRQARTYRRILVTVRHDLCKGDVSRYVANERESNGNTMLHEVLQHEHSYFAEETLKNLTKHFDIETINHQNSDGDTPLHCAIRNQIKFEILRFVINKGALLTIRNKNNVTPLELAHQLRSLQTTQRLCELVMRSLRLYALHRVSVIDFVQAIRDPEFQRKAAQHFLIMEGHTQTSSSPIYQQLASVARPEADNAFQELKKMLLDTFPIVPMSEAELTAMHSIQPEPSQKALPQEGVELRKSTIDICTELRQNENANYANIDNLLQGDDKIKLDEPLNMNDESKGLNLGEYLIVKTYMHRLDMLPIHLNSILHNVLCKLSRHEIEKVAESLFLQFGQAVELSRAWLYQMRIVVQLEIAEKGFTPNAFIVEEALKNVEICNMAYKDSGLTIAEKIFQIRSKFIVKASLKISSEVVYEILRIIFLQSNSGSNLASQVSDIRRLQLVWLRDIRLELAKGVLADMDRIVCLSRTQELLGFDCQMGNGLTIGEQLLAHVYLNRTHPKSIGIYQMIRSILSDRHAVKIVSKILLNNHMPFSLSDFFNFCRSFPKSLSKMHTTGESTPSCASLLVTSHAFFARSHDPSEGEHATHPHSHSVGSSQGSCPY